MRYFLLASLVVLFAGCHRDPMVEVAGKITYENVPVERGTISFQPADGKGPSEEQPIIAGEYRMRLMPGKKTVRIFGYKKIGEYRVSGPDSPLIDELEQILPARYNEQTTLEREIAADHDGPVDFPLEK